MKRKILVGVLAAVLGAIGYFGVNSSNNRPERLLLDDVEAVASCELPDGYSANGHCVSNDRNEHFCSNIDGEQNCYQ